MTLPTFSRAALALALTLSAASCSEEDAPSKNTHDDDTDSGTQQPGDDGAGTDASVPDEDKGDPSYVVVARGEEVSYLVQVPALGAGVKSDYKGIEIPGEAIGVGFGDDPYLYVGSSSGPDLIRYKSTKSGLVEDTRISFAAHGTASTGGYQSNLLLASKTKAYYLDSANSQIVIWNPSEMTVIGKVEHESINRAGIRTGTSGFPVLANGKFFIGLGWLNSQTLDVDDGAAVLVIDTESDKVTVARDPKKRCGYSFSVVEGTDGIYVGTESFGAAQNALSPSSVAPCMLRLDPETLEYDADYQVSLNGLVAGAPAGTLVPGEEAGKAYLRALDEAALGMTLDQWKTGGMNGAPVGNARVLSSRAAWTWFDLTLGDEPKATALEHAASSGATLRIDTGAETLIPEFDNANGSTDIRDFDGHLYGDIVLSAQGHVRSVVRVLTER